MEDYTISNLMLPNLFFVFLVAMSVGFGLWVAIRFPYVSGSKCIAFAFVAVAVLFASVLVDGPVPVWFGVWSIPLLAGLSCIAVIDLRTKTIPDVIVVPLIIMGLLHAVFQGGLVVVFGAAVAAIILLGIIGGMIARGREGWVGGGDVLLLAAAVAWLGPALLPDILFLTSLALFIHVMIALVRKKILKLESAQVSQLPLAPSLNLAVAIVWLGGPVF